MSTEYTMLRRAVIAATRYSGLLEEAQLGLFFPALCHLLDCAVLGHVANDPCRQAQRGMQLTYLVKKKHLCQGATPQTRR